MTSGQVLLHMDEATSVAQDGFTWCPCMMGMGFGFGGLMGFLFMILFIILIIVVIYALVNSLGGLARGSSQEDEIRRLRSEIEELRRELRRKGSNNE